jgi:hypothetical protein
LAVAGSDAAVLLSGGISLSIHERGGTLDVSGMEDLGNDVSSHLSWVEMIDLLAGDRVTVKFVEAATATPPSEARRTDSPKYAAERAAESPRVLRRLFFLRGLSHEEVEQVFT